MNFQRLSLIALKKNVFFNADYKDRAVKVSEYGKSGIVRSCYACQIVDYHCVIVYLVSRFAFWMSLQKVCSRGVTV